MTVSVLLAVHNGEPFLREAIHSVIQQTHQDWELIIASNGSSDATDAIAGECSDRDARIRFLRLPRRNKNAGYNAAFAVARGQYVCFFAADDLLPPTSLEERIAVLRDTPATTFSTCCLRTISADPTYDGLVFPRNVARPNYSGGSMLFPRSLAAKIFPLPESLPNEDTWTRLHLQAFGTTHHIPKPLYLYRIHTANSYGYELTFEQKREKYLQRMQAYQLFFEKFSNDAVPYLRGHVVPFLTGLRAAAKRSMFRILLVPRLDLRSKLVLMFYCSKNLYRLRHSYFRAFSGGVAP